MPAKAGRWELACKEMRFQLLNLSPPKRIWGIKMNYLLILIILAFIWRMSVGYKHGMVKELKAFLSFLVSAFSIVLICKTISAYLNENGMSMFVSILLLIILGIGFKILKLVFFSAETIARLPVIHLADKVLGIVMGAIEIIAVSWAFFLVLDMLDHFHLGIFAKMAAAYIKDSNFLTYLYTNNLFRKLLEH